MNGIRSSRLGVVVFVGLIFILIFLIYSNNQAKKKRVIDMIEIVGNKILSKENYRKFTGLEDLSKNEGLTLRGIKDRFERHPYIKRADVEYVGNNTVIVDVVEKKIYAILLIDSEPYFITDTFQILPIMDGIKYFNFPVISNIIIKKKIKPFEKLENDEIIEAFKIIDAIKLVNKEMLKYLTEINMRNGGDIILTFSGIKPPVIFGKGQTAKKIIYLEALWNSIKNNENYISDSEYIDLRFAGEIYLGEVEKTGYKQ